MNPKNSKRKQDLAFGLAIARPCVVLMDHNKEIKERCKAADFLIINYGSKLIKRIIVKFAVKLAEEDHFNESLIVIDAILEYGNTDFDTYDARYKITRELNKYVEHKRSLLQFFDCVPEGPDAQQVFEREKIALENEKGRLRSYEGVPLDEDTPLLLRLFLGRAESPDIKGLRKTAEELIKEFQPENFSAQREKDFSVELLTLIILCEDLVQRLEEEDKEKPT